MVIHIGAIEPNPLHLVSRSHAARQTASALQAKATHNLTRARLADISCIGVRAIGFNRIITREFARSSPNDSLSPPAQLPAPHPVGTYPSTATSRTSSTPRNPRAQFIHDGAVKFSSRKACSPGPTVIAKSPRRSRSALVLSAGFPDRRVFPVDSVGIFGSHLLPLRPVSGKIVNHRSIKSRMRKRDLLDKRRQCLESAPGLPKSSTRPLPFDDLDARLPHLRGQRHGLAQP